MIKSVVEIVVFDSLSCPIGHYELGECINITYERKYFIKKISQVSFKNDNQFLNSFYDNMIAKRESSYIEQKWFAIPILFQKIQTF